jgi:hypothetical protein
MSDLSGQELDAECAPSPDSRARLEEIRERQRRRKELNPNAEATPVITDLDFLLTELDRAEARVKELREWQFNVEECESTVCPLKPAAK